MDNHTLNETVLSIRLLKNYIEHARKIHNKGNPHYYRRLDRLDALARCERHYEYFKLLHPIIACRLIPTLKRDLYTILPVMANSSYQGSLKRLENLLQLCETINKQTHEVREPGHQYQD